MKADQLHPRPERAMFIPRLAHGQQALVPLLYERGIRATSAPLYYIAHNPQLSMVPSDRPMGSILDPFSHYRQLPWADRAPAFRAMEYGDDPEPYIPDAAALPDNELLRLAIDPVEAQRGRGATLLLTTYHLAGLVGTRGRDIELLLAELAIAHFRAQGIVEPPPFAVVDIAREIYATIAVRVPDLRSPRDRFALAQAYLALAADGYWVKIEGLHERARPEDIRAGGAFLAAMREGGRSVVSCGPGQLYLALLADEVSSSIGLAEGERYRAPSPWRRNDKDGKPRGRSRMAYHPKYHWSFRVGSDEASKAFREARCDCGVHPAMKPPTGLLVAQHAAILRADQAAEALDGDRQERREWLLASSTMASWAAGDAGVEHMHTSEAKYRHVFDGLDSGAGGAAVGEQDEL